MAAEANSSWRQSSRGKLNKQWTSNKKQTSNEQWTNKQETAIEIVRRDGERFNTDESIIEVRQLPPSLLVSSVQHYLLCTRVIHVLASSVQQYLLLLFWATNESCHLIRQALHVNYITISRGDPACAKQLMCTISRPHFEELCKERNGDI